MKVWAIALNTLREAIRNKILYSIAFFAVLMVGIAAVFGSASIGEPMNVSRTTGRGASAPTTGTLWRMTSLARKLDMTRSSRLRNGEMPLRRNLRV